LLGAFVLAIKTGSLPLVAGAPSFLASPLWGYVPLILLVLTGVVWLVRSLSARHDPHALITGPISKARSASTAAAPIGAPEIVWASTPNVDLHTVYGHMVDSVWANNHRHEDENIDQELRDKLHLRRLPVFGRVAVGGALNELTADAWETVRFDPDTGCAHAPSGEPTYFDIQFDLNDVNRVWPTEHSWMGR
jgi:hypothetical protein